MLNICSEDSIEALEGCWETENGLIVIVTGNMVQGSGRFGFIHEKATHLELKLNHTWKLIKGSSEVIWKNENNETKHWTKVSKIITF